MNYDDELKSVDLNLDWDLFKSEEQEISTSSISDGLIYSLRNYGKVDIDYISKITGSSRDEVIEKLKGSIYLDPSSFYGDRYQGYKTSDEYLAGNLINKLRIAEIYNKKYQGLFDDNIKALKEIMPKAVTSAEIYFNIGSPWIPKEILVEFFKNTFVENPDDQEYLYFNDATNIWTVKVIGRRISQFANERYGTNRISGVKVFENLLNSKPIAVYRYEVINHKKVAEINETETQAALDKANNLEKAFEEYIRNNEYLYKKLTDAYNDKYGYVVARTFNGDFLDFPNMNKDIKLFKAQVDAVARIIFNPNTLLAFNVGAGKTYIMIASGEELLRIGLSKKNLYVVPNAIIGQWASDYKYLYPNSKFLVVNTKDFNPANINKTLEIIKNGDYKSIIMGQSSFDRLEMSKKFEINYLNEKINKLKAIPENERTRSVNMKLQALEKELDKANNSIPTQIPFDELGITRLYIDEAHNYKNIPLQTQRGFIRGINLTGTNKCEHMKKVCDYLNSIENAGIIMATGTPISNSISDIYSIQVYLQEGELKLFDIKSFDDWLSMFSESVDEIELDLDANRFRSVKRLSRFHNLPELSNILSSVATFHYDYNSDDLPMLDGYNNIKIKPSIDFKKYIEVISKRLDDIRKHRVKYKDDNLLKVTSDGRKAALDLRLIDPNIYANFSADKISKCALNIIEIYNKTKDFLGTQLVFCDISVPNAKNILFNVYDDLKNRLERLGIPGDEIAYIHNYNTESKKEKLFDNMRKGIVRVLIGSTPLLGLGVNIQNKLYALHHLDIPWRPSDMVQREGRILRIGNTNRQVYIYRYITEGSFDAYSWQILETKQKFINELLSNSISDRNKEDISVSVLSYAEAKALAIGNPKLKEHAEIQNELAKFKLLAKKNNDTKALYKRELMEIPNKIKDLEEYISKLKIDIDNYNSHYQEYTALEKNNICKTIWNALINNINGDNEKEIMNYNGFVVKAPESLIENNFYLYLENENRYHVLLGTSQVGINIRIDNVLNGLSNRLEKNEEELHNLKERKEVIETALSEITDYTEIISELNQRLIILDKELNKNGK